MSSERFQRPQTAAGAQAVGGTDLPPHPPDVRDEEIAEVLAASFPIALRGYERAAVDAYVQRVSRVVAGLQAGRSPQSAVRYALEQVSEETRAILQQAHDTADAITSKSRSQAAERLDASERESAQVLADAERRVREAEDDVASLWQDRERLVEDARDVAARLAEVADDAAERLPPPVLDDIGADTGALPAAPVWNDDPEDEFALPAPSLRAVPPTELGPMDEPAAPSAVDEAAVPAAEDDDDTAERPR